MVELIPAIINKFRLCKFGITADIEKAFLHIGLQEEDKPFLRFLWWGNGYKENTKIYQHKRVVFGISSHPFLLGATLDHHLKQGTRNSPADQPRGLEAGILNSADLPSRGCGPEELAKSLWWEGPSWLKKPCEEWTLSEACPDFAIINSERKRTVASTIDNELKELNYLPEISSYEKIIRVMAWIFRFYNNIRKQQNDRDFGNLNTQETDAAERAVLKIVQTQSFPNDTNSLISQKQMLGKLRNFSQSQVDVIKEGDIVLIGHTNSKRIYFQLVKVMKLIPGRDGRVRVVEVSTGGGSFLRPIQRLYPLEVSGADRAVW
ncbi:hypothetical protein AVEN_133278-1 [Araneus ventricosus]|uniref:DUF5641 domain-containing protein n=1 Tax=Araneus ventricosus TaxID=182803 RepID=A0A4Y2DJU8_ARAVE|nr:hypothetical protein AVEN_133278-1 [Araneus ventricosus]